MRMRTHMNMNTNTTRGTTITNTVPLATLRGRGRGRWSREAQAQTQTQTYRHRHVLGYHGLRAGKGFGRPSDQAHDDSIDEVMARDMLIDALIQVQHNTQQLEALVSESLLSL